MHRLPDEPARETVRRPATSLVDQSGSLDQAVAAITTADRHRMIEALAIVESAAVTSSVPRLTPADLDEADRLHQQIATLPRNAPDTVPAGLSDRLHRLFVSRCPNGRLREIFDEELTLLRALTAGAPASWAVRLRIVAEHAELLGLVRTGADGAAVTALLRRHRHVCL